MVGPTCQGLIPYAVFITLCFLSNKLLVVKTYGSWYTHKRRGGGDCEYYYANGRPIQNTASRSFSARFSPASHIKVHIILSAGAEQREEQVLLYRREGARGAAMNIILFCLRLLISTRAHRPLISEACAAPMTAAASNFIPFICVSGVWLKTNEQPTALL